MKNDPKAMPPIYFHENYIKYEEYNNIMRLSKFSARKYLFSNTVIRICSA